MCNCSATQSIEYGNIESKSITIAAANHQKLSLIEKTFFLTLLITSRIAITDITMKIILFIYFTFFTPMFWIVMINIV